MNKLNSALTAACVGFLVLASGCATVPGPPSPSDPWEGYNRAMYKFNDTIDRGFFKPVAQGYDAVMPNVAKTGVRNFFGNLGDVTIVVNDLLQAKFKEAVSNTGRVLVNTTIGIGGLFDVGSVMGLAKGNEDFGQTLGVWGAGPGPYFVLPFFGPSTVRDAFGRVGDYFAQYPRYIDHVPERNSLTGLDIVSTRASLLGAGAIISGAALDEYTFVRDGYLQRRERLIHDGNVPVQKDEFEDEAAEDSAGARADKASKPDAEDAKDKKDEVEKPGAAEKK